MLGRYLKFTHFRSLTSNFYNDEKTSAMVFRYFTLCYKLLISQRRWSKIAKQLPGRTDNEIKNFWRTRIQKHMKQTESFQQQSNSETNDHQACTSQVSTIAEPMETYSPSCYQGMLEPFSAQFHTNPDHSSCCTNDNTNYWSMEDILSMQLANY